LELPFLVLATQNPIEQEGTYPLPEAQLDRFMFSINLEYPSFEEEIEVVKNTTTEIITKAASIVSIEEVLSIQQLIRKVPVTDNVIEYAVSLVGKTRPKSSKATDLVKKYVDWGAGPRASQNLILGAKAIAAVKGKYSPDIEDVKAVAVPILSHRIVKNYKAEAENISIVDIIESLL
ncbi:MAG: MoxR family ATPase, partial [Flavobacteriaceae bacterium]|nr:MoxR family ATPase [Flavobacteriaceae bacterium]